MERMIRIIKRGLFGIGILLLTTTTYASSVGDYLELKRHSDQVRSNEIIEASFDNLIEGIIFTEAAVSIVNGEKTVNDHKIKKFYCSPPKYQFSGKELMEYVDEYLGNYSVSGDERLAFIAVMALKEKFPCK
ncbi:hypothetical protein [Providencia sp. PROV197]|uniref:hypothetical protein n=1 Tax=Providencia sp. PROV197 TaxID=2949898 RepID=UPI002349BAD7|nr:hypothetical protein [Providencia sp. PROV197]